jgi:hypothetical protein
MSNNHQRRAELRSTLSCCNMGTMSNNHQRRPDLRSALSSSNLSVDSQLSNVSFGTTEVREYERVLGNHRQVSIGLGMGWDYQQQEPIPVESYRQNNEGPLKKSTSINERLTILKDFGFSQKELQDAEAQRSETHQKTSKKQRVKSMVSGLRHSMKRLSFLGKNESIQVTD